MRLRSREAGSANSFEVEARPNCGQKRKAKGPRGLWRGGGQGQTATNGESGYCILEKEFTKRPNCSSVIGTRVEGTERIVVEGEGVEMGCGEKVKMRPGH